MSSGNRKPGPAAGDSDLRNNAIIESLFVSRESELATLSEPRHANANATTLVPPPVQHRQSLPVENTQGNYTEYSQLPATRALSDAIALHVPINRTANNNSDNPEEILSPIQMNNNMADDQQPRRVRFADQERRSKLSKSALGSGISRKPSIADKEDFPGFGTLQPDFLNAGIKLKTAAPKSMAYRRAQILCLVSVAVILAFILFETIFMLGCIYLKRNCPSIAGFICRVALLSIIIAILEWIRAYLWRDKSPVYDRFPQSARHVGSDDAMHLQMMVGSLNGEDQSAPTTVVNPPVLQMPTSISAPVSDYQVERRRCFDGKQVTLAIIATVFYFTVIVLLLDAAVWIPVQLFNATARTQNMTSPIITHSNGTTDQEKACSSSGIYVGLVYLAIHATLIVLRIVAWCIANCGSSVRLFVSRYRATGRAAHAIMEVPFSSELTTCGAGDPAITTTSTDAVTISENDRAGPQRKRNKRAGTVAVGKHAR